MLKKHYGNEWRSITELQFYTIIDQNTKSGDREMGVEVDHDEQEGYWSETDDLVLRNFFFFNLKELCVNFIMRN